MGTEVILDLGNARTWKNRVKEIIDAVFPESVLKEIRKCHYDDLYYDTFSYGIEAHQKAGEPASIHYINGVLEEAFTNTFTHVRGFHACRPNSLERYRKEGIKPLNRDFLLEEALRIFNEHATEVEIRNAVAAYDLKYREGRIFFFTDLKSPLEDNQNHYLLSGSEALQGLSIDLKAHCRGILANQGEPYIVQCKVPLKDIETGFSECTFREIVTRYFENELSKGKIGLRIMDSCIATDNGVQIKPENIEQFIPVDKNKLIPRWMMDPH